MFLGAGGACVRQSFRHGGTTPSHWRNVTPEELAQVSREIRTEKIKVYHGGFPGLQIGDAPLPASVTQSHNLSDVFREIDSEKQIRKDRIYITTDRFIAVGVAAHYAKRPGSEKNWGAVYQVMIGPDDVEIDTDTPKGPYVTFQCTAATVVKVLAKGVNPEVPENSARLASFIDEVRAAHGLPPWPRIR
jgi:hypothetical protein